MFNGSIHHRLPRTLGRSAGPQSIAKRILVVEDEQIVARDLQNMLRRLGHVPLGPAESGSDAIRLVVETVPDLVLMDVRLEGEMDGVEASIEIASKWKVPIVYITAYSQQFLAEPSRMVFPYLCIAKPFSPQALELTIDSILKTTEIRPS